MPLPKSFSVGDWQVHPASNTLDGPEGSTTIEPRSMDVLVELAAHAGDVCTRQDLLDAVWGADAFVGEAVLSHCIWDLRRTLGDDARQPRYIQTVPRRGYRVVAEVSFPEESPPPDGPSDSAPPEIEARPTVDSSPSRVVSVTIVVVVALSIAAILGWWWQRPREARLVAILPVDQAAERPELDLLADDTVVAAVSALSSLDRLALIEPRQVEVTGTANGTLDRTLAAVGAEQALAIRVEVADGLRQLSFRRLAADGRVLWAASLQGLADPSHDRALAEAIGARLHEGFADHPPRPGLRTLDIAPEPYSAYLELRRDLNRRLAPDAELLDEVGTVLERAPRFVEGHVLAAKLALRLSKDGRNRDHLTRAAAWLRTAEDLTGDDPRVLAARLELELLDERFEDARDTVRRIEAEIPGAPVALGARVRWLEARGEFREALRLRRQHVAVRPSWNDLFGLARLEERLGEVDAARRHLEQLLELAPDSRHGLYALAQIELLHGDLDAAETHFRHLAQTDGSRHAWSNLGTAHFLSGQFDAAADAYAEALRLDPGHPLVLVNLAEVEHARGRPEQTAARCTEALTGLAERSGDSLPTDPLLEALCLARTGDLREAARRTGEALRRHPDDAEVAYQAALVLTLTGDLNAATAQAERALELGVQPRWFSVPGFDALRRSGFDPATPQAGGS